MDKRYTFPILYFHESVYDSAGKELLSGRLGLAHKLIFQSALVNTKLVRLINMHATYTTDEILEFVKKKDYAKEFKGFINLGKNIAFPEISELHTNRDIGLIKCANNKDSEFEGEVKIVADGIPATGSLKWIISEGKYPLTVISLEDGVKDILYIHNFIKTKLIPSIK